MKNMIRTGFAIVCLVAMGATAGTVVYEAGFDDGVGSWASKVESQMPGLRQDTAIEGSEGVLTCDSITFMDAQLYATGSSSEQSMGLSLTDGQSWESVVIRLRQLDGARGKAGTAFQEFVAPGTSLVVFADGKGKERGQMVAGKAKVKKEADGWVVVTYDISDFSSSAQITNLRLDPIGNPQNVGKSFEIDFVKVIATP